jgi:hypothetical protein
MNNSKRDGGYTSKYIRVHGGRFLILEWSPYIYIYRPLKNQKPTTMHTDVFGCITTVSLSVIRVLRLPQNFSVLFMCNIIWCIHTNIFKLISRKLPEFIPNPWRGSNICTNHSGNRQIRKYKKEYKAANKLESSVETADVTLIKHNAENTNFCYILIMPEIGH